MLLALALLKKYWVYELITQIFNLHTFYFIPQDIVEYSKMFQSILEYSEKNSRVVGLPYNST